MAPSAIEQAALPVKTAPGQKKTDDHDPTPLEAISHGDVMPGIPTFPDFASHRRHVLTHAAAVFRTWARTGCAEGQSGHISVRDPEFPGYMWMNPLGRHFGTLAAGDMLLLDVETGAVVAGAANPATRRRTANAAGYFIHAAIHRARGDVHAICHA